MSHWSPIDPDGALVTHDKVTPSGWSFRTVAVRLSDDRLLVYSPTRGLGDEAHRELVRLGRPDVLLAPNHFHYLGLSEWLGRYEGSRAVATATAAPRIHKKCGQTAEPLRAVELPDGVEALPCAGNKAGETWLRVRTDAGTAWVVCDAFFNAPRHPTGMAGLFTRLSGTTAGLRIGGTLRLLHLSDVRAYRAWLLERLEEAPPAVLVPSHGDVLAAPDLADRLRRLVAERLG